MRAVTTHSSNHHIFHPAELDQLNAVQIADAQVTFFISNANVRVRLRRTSSRRSHARKEGKSYRKLQRRCIINLAGGMDGENGCRDIDPDQTRTRKKV